MFKTGYKELSMLLIKDTNLVPILDSVVSFDKNCEGYHEPLVFSIDVSFKKENADEFYELLIASHDDINLAMDSLQPFFGYFYYKNYLFLVFGEAAKKFFSTTKTKKKFTYIIYDEDYKFKIGYYDVDDSYPYWYCYYIDNRFIFKGRPNCE
jgi:hypothetical protein